MPGNVRVPALQTVRMLGRDLAARTGRHPDHERHAELIARHVTHGCRRVQNLVQRQQAEIDGHQLDDRSHAGHRSADARAGEPGLRQRSIANALRAKLREQPVADRIAAAIAADVLTHQENALVAPERVAKRLANGFAISHLRGYRSGGCVLHGAHRLAVGATASA